MIYCIQATSWWWSTPSPPLLKVTDEPKRAPRKGGEFNNIWDMENWWKSWISHFLCKKIWCSDSSVCRIWKYKHIYCRYKCLKLGQCQICLEVMSWLPWPGSSPSQAHAASPGNTFPIKSEQSLLKVDWKNTRCFSCVYYKFQHLHIKCMGNNCSTYLLMWQLFPPHASKKYIFVGRTNLPTSEHITQLPNLMGSCSISFSEMGCFHRLGHV